MTPKEKAENLINQYRMILMSEDTECGNEILCTSIAIKNALIAVYEVMSIFHSLPLTDENLKEYFFWEKVKQEIKKL